MSEDPSNAGDAPANGGQGGQVALLSDPVDVIIDKLLRYVVYLQIDPDTRGSLPRWDTERAAAIAVASLHTDEDGRLSRISRMMPGFLGINVAHGTDSTCRTICCAVFHQNPKTPNYKIFKLQSNMPQLF